MLRLNGRVDHISLLFIFCFSSCVWWVYVGQLLANFNFAIIKRFLFYIHKNGNIKYTKTQKKTTCIRNLLYNVQIRIWNTKCALSSWLICRFQHSTPVMTSETNKQKWNCQIICIKLKFYFLATLCPCLMIVFLKILLFFVFFWTK